MYRNFGYIRKHRVVLLAILGISWFWFFGATFLAQIPNYTKTVLNGDESVVTLLLTLFSIGIGAGSLLCDRLSGNRVEIGLVPLGSIGLTVFGIDLFFAHPTASNELVNAGVFLTNVSNWRIIIDLVLIGLFGGFYIVPLNAMVQQRTEASHRARVIASNNILNACFMVVSAVFAIVAFKLSASIPQLLLITALLNAGVAIYIYTLVPEFLMRFLIWLLIHTMYKVKSNNLEHIPEKGPVLLVCNHVSYVDALIIGGCIRRPVRFVMYHRIYNLPILKFVFKTAKAIPIAPAKENEELLESAYQQIDEALNNGEVVCIFPEGKITTDGKLNEFKSGVEKIVERTPVPVIPMGLSGLWGSFFSYRDGKAMQKWPKRFWAKVKLTVAPAITDKEITANNVQQKVHKLLKKLEQ